MECVICHNDYKGEDCPSIYFTEYKGVLVCDSCIFDLANIQAEGNGEPKVIKVIQKTIPNKSSPKSLCGDCKQDEVWCPMKDFSPDSMGYTMHRCYQFKA